MTELFAKFVSIFSKTSEKDAYLLQSIHNITQTKPKNIQLYRLAVCHTSAAKSKEGVKYSNERLEYLGDAILGAIIAEHLFKKFPYKDEGFLTEMRSRIVNRDSLNELGKTIGLSTIVEHAGAKNGRIVNKSLYGDALEALIGAIYLDKGFKTCKKFIISVLLTYLDFDALINNQKNYKSLLIEFAQKDNKKITFLVIDEAGMNHTKQFTSQVTMDEEILCTGLGFTKKKAEQSAAENACKILRVV